MIVIYQVAKIGRIFETTSKWTRKTRGIVRI